MADAAVDWLRGHLAVGDVVVVKAFREARLDEVAAALAKLGAVGQLRGRAHDAIA